MNLQMTLSSWSVSPLLLSGSPEALPVVPLQTSVQPASVLHVTDLLSVPSDFTIALHPAVHFLMNYYFFPSQSFPIVSISIYISCRLSAARCFRIMPVCTGIHFIISQNPEYDHKIAFFFRKRPQHIYTVRNLQFLLFIGFSQFLFQLVCPFYP